MKIFHALVAVGLLAGASLAVSVQDDAKKGDDAVIAAQLPSYPLTTCLVSGEELTKGEEFTFVVDGKMARTCCGKCAEKVKAAPADFVAKIDAAVVAAQKASYPMKTCPVSGEELGSMGDAIDVVTGTRLVRVCCKGCIKKVHADPAVLAKVDAALIEAQKKTYPLTTCPVSGEELGGMGDPIDVLYGTQLVRLCCKGCMKGFKKDPAAVVAKIQEAQKKG